MSSERPPATSHQPPATSMSESDRVKAYIRDQSYGWLPASIVFIKEGRAFVRIELPSNWHASTVLCQDSGLEDLEDELANGRKDVKTPSAFRSVPLEAYPNDQLPLQNNLKDGNRGDLKNLPHLHEASILYNLKERLALGKPYTRVRDIIVAVNPLKWLDDIYSSETQSYYATKFLCGRKDDNMSGGNEEKKDDGVYRQDEGERNSEPHIYEVSCLAYRGLLADGQDQTIMVTGESGSGKTETAKLLLQQLTALEKTGHGANIADKVLLGSTLLEAFGNAKTRRNNNSSRFGKLVSLHYSFDNDAEKMKRTNENPGSLSLHRLQGCTYTAYLVEKTRVFSRAVGERSFHVFYQLLSAPDDFKQKLWPWFNACKATEFKYLAPSGECQLEALDGYDNWEGTQIGLDGFNIRGDGLLWMMRALAIVLQMGNVTFGEAFTTDGQIITVVTSEKAMNRLCSMMGVDQVDLETSLLFKSVKVDNEEIRTQQCPAAAKESFDALAAEIYSRIFSFLVGEVNQQLEAKDEDTVCGSIALADIYGFERLAVNRFEQLCINYANEQLQQKYVADNFRLLKLEYDSEGIDIFDFSLIDNSAVLSLLDGRAGVFVTLQEECNRPDGNDVSFVEKFKKSNIPSDLLIQNTQQIKTEFEIKHFAGPVTYDAAKFVARNMDLIQQETLSCVAKTSNTLLRTELQSVLKQRTCCETYSEPSLERKKGPTRIEIFSSELRDFIVEIERTQTRYIRCIIPNEAMLPGVTNHLLALRQLEYAGLMTSVALARESLPDCRSYQPLLNRFGPLLEKTHHESMKEMLLPDQIVFLLTNLFTPLLRREGGSISSMPFACGKTKVYLRAGALDHLETMRHLFYLHRAVLIQTWFRGFLAKQGYNEVYKKIFVIQAFLRGFIQRQRLRQIRIHSQSRHRVGLGFTLLVGLQVAAKLIQTTWRANSATRNYRKLRAAVTVLQRKSRTRERLFSRTNDMNGPAPGAKRWVSACQVVNINMPLQGKTGQLKSINLHTIMTEMAFLQSEQERIKAVHHQEIQKLRSVAEQNNRMHLEKFTKFGEEVRLAKEKHLKDEKAESRRMQIDYVKQTEELAARLSESSAENVALQMKHQLLESNSQSEKSELCKMLKEVDASYDGKLCDVQERYRASQETQRRLQVERDSLLAAHEQEMKDLSTVFSEELHEKNLEMLENEEQHNFEKIVLNSKKEELLQSIANLKEQSNFKVLQLQEQADLSVKAHRNLKSGLNQLRVEHAKEKEKMMTELANCRQKESDLVVKEAICTQEGAVKSEESQLREALESADNKYKEEIRQLREELFWALNAQQQLKSEISDMESSHTEEVETSKRNVAKSDLKIGGEYECFKEKLKHQELNSRGEKEELCKMLKFTDEAHQKEIQKLSGALLHTQESHRQLKLEASRLQAVHAEELEKMMTRTLDYANKDGEIISLQDVIGKQEDHIHLEKERIRSSLKLHFEEVRGLKEEFVLAQDSHRKHLQQILGYLETVEYQRDKEVALLLEELDAMKKDKSELKVVCTEQLACNNCRQPPCLSTIEEDHKADAGAEIRWSAHLEDKFTLHSKYSQEFLGTLQKLQRAIKPENLKYIIDKLKKKRDTNVETKVFAEIHRLSVELGETYQKEGHSLGLIDQALLSYLNGVHEMPVSIPATRRKPNLLKRKSDPDLVLLNLQERMAAIEKKCHAEESPPVCMQTTKLLA